MNDHNGMLNECICESHPAITWQPSKKVSNLDKFQKYVEEKYNVSFENYWKFHEWSVENFPEFWSCIWHYFNIVHSVTYSEVFDKTRSFDNMCWFQGAKLNYTENIFKHRDSHLALVVTNEEDQVEKVTYQQMYEQVAQYASALKALGVKVGDRVTCFMSNRKEAIMAFLATASIGATWSASLPYFGSEAAINRLSQISPKILFTIDRFVCEGKEIDMLSKVMRLEKGLPTLEKIIIVPSSANCLKNQSPVPKSCWLPDFLKLGSLIADLEFEQVPFDHPLSISYTSGTTGKPKALVHSVGSFLSAVRDFALHQNCTRDDVILSISPAGWISWNIFVNGLHVGLTLCLYEGSPYYISPTAFWDIVEKFDISYVFLPSSIIEDFRRMSYLPNSNHTLKNLRLFIGTCSPVKPQLYDFVTETILKPRNPETCFISLYGCTEAMGYVSGMSVSMPIYRGEIQCFALGIDAKCVDEQGNYVIGKRGNLVIGKPIPSFPIKLYDDMDNKILIASYLTNHPGHWDQHDECWINPVTGGFVILGRSDETMKQYGERISSSDIYSTLDSIEEIEDCICVSQMNNQMDERIILFVKLAAGNHYSSDLEKKIKTVIGQSLTEDYIPSVILQAPEIPYNFSRKKMELLVKGIINKKAVPNREVLINPSSLDFYENVQLSDF